MDMKNAFFILVTLMLFACKESKNEFSTPNFTFSFDNKGKITALSDKAGGVNYVKFDESNALMSIRINNQIKQPTSAAYDASNGLVHLSYAPDDIAATIQITSKENYLTLELISLTNKEEVELILWGPYQTTIKEIIGETIGVARNRDFAIGIQALNPRTLGGFPTNEDDSTPSFDIFASPSLIDVPDSMNILYRGNVALPRAYGSSLQAYTRNRAKERIIPVLDHEKYMSPAYEDEGLIGSKIALFGCSPDKVLDVIEAIELTENLPHPTLGGVWAKKAVSATSAYLIMYFNAENIDEAIDLTQKAGLKYLYHGGPFHNWGKFDLNKESFPNNWESMKNCVDKAAEKGIKVGVHTLSNFITTNDPYVTPIPDKRLAKVGTSTLVQAIDAQQKNIEIADPTFFSQMKNNSLHAAVIEEEIIRYETVSEEKPWTLLNCERGAFGTTATAHDSGNNISKLIDHPYKTFLTTAELGVEMSDRIVDLFNTTGLKQISFDGLEGNRSTGMGAYGELLFVKNWYDKLKPEIKNDYIMDASRPGHFFWHMFTRMNWGEPWYAGFRESQTAYRLLNQDYFRRNFIPSMLGWFNMKEHTSIEDIEWMLARSAAFDAGYALVTSPDLIEQNGFGAQILEKIKQWEKARMSKAFSASQKKRMEDIKAEFSLEAINKTSWNLTPLNVQRFEHKKKVRQPGEPLSSSFSFENKYVQQPLQFILTTSGEATASNISIEIDNFKKINLDIVLQPNQYLKYTGGEEVILYNQSWNKVKSIKIDPTKLLLSQGEHNFKVDCAFKGGEQAGLKLELKTAGERERVGD